MRLVIDLQGAQSASRHRGIGRYSLSLTKEILRQRGDDEVFIVLNELLPEAILAIRSDLAELLPLGNVLTWSGVGPASLNEGENRARSELAEATRELFISSLCPDIVLVTSLFEGVGDDAVVSIKKYHNVRTACIAYDLIPYLHPSIYLPSPLIHDWYSAKIAQLRDADLLLAISDATAREVRKCLGHDKVVNISTAADGQFYSQPVSQDDRDRLAERFGIDRQFLLYTSAPDERKNHLRLISAFALLPAEVRDAYQLVLAGPIPPPYGRAFHEQMDSDGLSRDDVVMTGQVTDAALSTLYNACAAFVFPSWHEGFGLPVLEAMQCGKAVIASNVSSLPEVVGLPDALFDPWDIHDIRDSLLRVLTDEPFRRRLEEHSLEQAKLFNWSTTAATALAAMRAAVGAGARSPSAAAARRTTENARRQLLALGRAAVAHAGVNRAELAVAIANNFRVPPSPRQLLVDVSELVKHDSRTGIQRVVRSILKHWLTSETQEYSIELVYYNPFAGYCYARNFSQKVFGLSPAESLDDPTVQVYQGDVFVGLDLNHGGVIASAALFETWRRRGVRVSFVLYDLLPVSLAHCFPDEVGRLHAKWLAVLSQSDRVISISRTVADEFGEWLISHGEERKGSLALDFFHLGADIENSSPTRGLPEGSGEVLASLQASTTFLMVGTIEPRKGHAEVLKAFDRLWREGRECDLVIVGKPGWNIEPLIVELQAHKELGKRLYWFDQASDEFLGELYRAGDCLIAASEGEGFGLPLIEAAQAGLPILARDIPVFREVAGKFATYFSGEPMGKKLSAALASWLDNHRIGKTIPSTGIPWSTWSDAAGHLLKIVTGEGETYRSWSYEDRSGSCPPRAAIERRADLTPEKISGEVTNENISA